MLIDLAGLKFIHYNEVYYCNYASIMHRNAMTVQDAIAISTPEGATSDSYKQSPEGGYVIPRVFVVTLRLSCTISYLLKFNH